MRTMLISLILFCSLTQFAIADDGLAAPAAPTVARKTVEGCGKIYQCYAPEICTNKDAAGKPLTDYAVEEVKANTEVTDDCPAIFRYHGYKDFFVYVSMESYQKKEIVDSIEFIQQDYKGQTKANFLCKFDGDKTIGEHNDKQRYTKEELPSKLECNFDVRTFRSKEIFLSKPDDQISFKINGTSTKIQEFLLTTRSHCDPSNLEFNDELNEQELHEKVEYIPGKAYCKEELYKIKWNKPTASGERNYIPASISCAGRTFVINGEEIPEDTTIDIRCTAEVKYFCNYKLKPKAGEVAPNTVPPNFKDGKGTSLECPAGKSHVIMVLGQREEPIKMPECRNYGTHQFWTVNDLMITKDGPPIYCTHELRCELLNKIHASSVRNGFVNKTFLPECHDKGTMSVENEKVVRTRCDYTNGKFMYTVISNNAEVERKIDDSTIFLCKYPKVANEAKNKENQEKIIVGSLVVAGGGVALALAALGLVIACACIRLKLDRRRMDAVNNEAWMRYAADPDEKETMEMKNKKIARSAEKEPQEQKWNALITSRLYECRNALTTDDIGVGGSIPIVRKKKFINLPDESKLAAISSMVKFKGKMTTPPSTTPTMKALLKGTIEDFDARKKLIKEQREGPSKKSKHEKKE